MKQPARPVTPLACYGDGPGTDPGYARVAPGLAAAYPGRQLDIACDMRSHDIQALIDAVEARYGPVELYGSDPSQQHGTCFKIVDVRATFSVHTQEGALPPGQYDIQIEGVPPGDYIYISIVSLDRFMELIERLRGPEDQWPMND